MRSECDLDADALYIHLRDVATQSTEELADGTIVDLDGDGQLVGVEILAVSRGWRPDALRSRFPDLADRDIAHMQGIAGTGQRATRSGSGAATEGSLVQVYAGV